MNEDPTTAPRRSRRHLLSPERLAQGVDAADNDTETDLTRHHGEGNGLRVHGTYIAVLSLVALVALLVIAIVLGTMMM